jgi:hypothetical protein
MENMKKDLTDALIWLLGQQTEDTARHVATLYGCLLIVLGLGDRDPHLLIQIMREATEALVTSRT